MGLKDTSNHPSATGVFSSKSTLPSSQPASVQPTQHATSPFTQASITPSTQSTISLPTQLPALSSNSMGIPVKKKWDEQPMWVLEGMKYLRSTEHRYAWIHLIDHFEAIEQGLDSGRVLPCSGERAPKAGELGHWPDQVHWWLQHGRNYERVSKIVDINAYGAAFTAWWRLLQLSWRVGTANQHLPAPIYSIPKLHREERWVNLAVGGKNGLFMVLMAMAWWGNAVKESGKAKHLKLWDVILNNAQRTSMDSRIALFKRIEVGWRTLDNVVWSYLSFNVFFVVVYIRTSLFYYGITGLECEATKQKDKVKRTRQWVPNCCARVEGWGIGRILESLEWRASAHLDWLW